MEEQDRGRGNFSIEFLYCFALSYRVNINAVLIPFEILQANKIFFSFFLVPICMPPDGADFTSKVATVSGWGRLKYGGGVPSVLQEVEVRTKIA